MASQDSRNRRAVAAAALQVRAQMVLRPVEVQKSWTATVRGTDWVELDRQRRDFLEQVAVPAAHLAH